MLPNEHVFRSADEKQTQTHTQCKYNAPKLLYNAPGLSSKYKFASNV